MESITLRQLLNIMPSDELVKPSICLKGENEFDNQNIFKVGELRESNSSLLDYKIDIFYPFEDISIKTANDGKLNSNKQLYTIIVLRRVTDE